MEHQKLWIRWRRITYRERDRDGYARLNVQRGVGNPRGEFCIAIYCTRYANRGALGQVKKLDSTTTDYFNKVNSMADILSSIDQPLHLEEFNSNLLAGLDSEYNALADLISSRPLNDPMPICDVFAQLQNTAHRIESRRADMVADTHMVRYMSKPGGGWLTQFQSPEPGPPSTRPVFSAPTSQSGGRRPDASGRSPGGTGGSRPCPTCGAGGSHPTCQICSKVGHVASCYFKRYQKNFLCTGNDGRNME
jgi:hypothetical protein